MSNIFFMQYVKCFSYYFFLVSFVINSFGCSSVKKAVSISENMADKELQLRIKLKGGETHHYSIELKAGELVHIKAVQYDLDVMAKVFTANGEAELIFDSPTGELGEEDIYLLSNEDRKYEIEIYPAQKYADMGEYAMRIVRKHKAAEADENWMAVLALTQKADKLRTKSETRQQSIEQYKLAALEWMKLKDTVQYANAMRSLGFVFIRQRNYQEAINTFNQLLPLWKQLGDTRSEGFTHLIIGRIYDLQKDYKTSLQYNLSSLPFWIKAKDTDQETFVLMNIGNLYGHLSDKQKAIDYFEMALKKNEKSERPSVKAVVLRDYATAMSTLGESQKAIDLFEQAIKQWHATENKPEEARTYVQLAAYYNEKGNKAKAVNLYRSAYEVWQKLGDQNEINKIKEVLDKLEK